MPLQECLQTPAEVLPVFPPELEREIFLLTARTYKGTAIRLMLVASRVKSWIEPFMYKTVVLRGAGHAFQFFSAIVNHRPPEFAQSHVKELCIRPSVPATVAIRILTACSGLDTLALWTTPHSNSASLVNLLSSLRLTFLSINLVSIQLPALQKLDLQHIPVFVNLTHLDVVENWALWEPSLGIEQLPRLTHLSVRFWPRGSVDSTLTTILRQSPNLQLVVLLADAVVMTGVREYLEKQGVHDIRVVVLQHSRDAEEWELMKRESMTIWQRAEYIVTWRRRHRTGPFDFPPDFDFTSTEDTFQPTHDA